jgi:hypothetical protein
MRCSFLASATTARFQSDALAFAKVLTDLRIRWRYFYGSSQGGREALAVAQRWPREYNGIVSVVPVLNQMVALAHTNVC